ncbi:MAG TPA: FmdB family zinc ribbon protein [Bacteroidota bacterium]|nr:FmdB family zinc ribbon protein [Bacteroidota bacterium]
MPTYEYKCKKCGHEFEEFQSMKAAPLSLCPVCHTENLVRVISSGGGMIFKGSGFYQTDYKNSKSDAKESKPKSPAPTKKPTTPEAKPDPPTKPAKSPE